MKFGPRGLAVNADVILGEGVNGQKRLADIILICE